MKLNVVQTLQYVQAINVFHAQLIQTVLFSQTRMYATWVLVLIVPLIQIVLVQHQFVLIINVHHVQVIQIAKQAVQAYLNVL